MEGAAAGWEESYGRTGRVPSFRKDGRIRHPAYSAGGLGMRFLDAYRGRCEAGRMGRGRIYASVGRVELTSELGPCLRSTVQGVADEYYLELSFRPLPSGERAVLVGLLGRRPDLRSILEAGTFPDELFSLLPCLGMEVLPEEKSSSCSCMDRRRPCKHLAALRHFLAEKIEQDPFLLFSLQGFDLRRDLTRAGPGDSAPMRELRPRKPGPMPEAPEPRIRLDGDFVFPVLSALRSRPACGTWDLRLALAEFHHFRARQDAAPLRSDNGAGLSAAAVRTCAFSIQTAGGSETFSGIEAMDPLSAVLRAERPNGSTATLGLWPTAPVFLNARGGRGASSFRYLFWLYRLFAEIIRAGAFSPAAEIRRGRLRVLWKPLSAAAVEEGIEAVGALCPPILRLGAEGSEPVWADGPSTTAFLLAGLCTAYVRSLEFSSRSGPEDTLFRILFRGEAPDAALQDSRAVLDALRSWLFVLDRRADSYLCRVRVDARGLAKNLEPRIFRLYLELARPGSDRWFRMDRGCRGRDAAEAESLAELLLDRLPESAARFGAPVVVEERRLLDFLRGASLLLNLLGADLLLPKGLAKELDPKLTVAPKLLGGHTPSFGLETIFQFEWRVAIGDQLYSLEEFRALAARGRRAVRLRDGFLSLEPDQLRRLFARSARPPSDLDAITAFLEGGAAFGPAERKAFRQLLAEKETPVPVGLAATLRPYQLRGYRWAWNNLANGFGCLLADDMGLGKTVQAIAVILKLKQEGRLSRGGLVVVPASLMINWRRELARFAPTLLVSDYYGPRRRLESGADLYLSTYETVLRDIPALSERPFSLLLADEVQGLKNAASKRAKALRRISTDSRLALSGTPVENRLEDLRAVMDLVLPGYLGDSDEFRRTWKTSVERMRNPEAAAALRAATAPFLLRRLKTDPAIAADLPAKTVIDERAALAPAQAAVYQTFLELMAVQLECAETPQERGAVVLKLLTGLKQVCNHPRVYDGASPAVPSLSGKAVLLLELLRTMLAGGEKVLVFSQYVKTLALLDSFIRENLGETCLILHGGLSAADRARAVDSFQTDPAHRIFLVSLKAGGVGLNLTAASRVVHYDLWYNPAVETQATDRAFRIGQKRNVFVHRLICAGTFEEKIDALIKSKGALAELSVARGESWLTDLSAPEIHALFRLD